VVENVASDDFSVAWKDPAQAEQTWLFDAMHFPRPMLPLAAEFLDRMYTTYMGAETIFVNGYAFTAHLSPPPPTPEMLERGAADIFMNDYLPRIREFCAAIRTADYEAMSLPALGAEVERIMADAVKTFGYTMKVIAAFMGPTFGLVHILEEQLGPEGPQLAATLLQGFENGTAAAGTGLSELAEEAARRPAVADALRSGRFEGVESLEGGREFMERFRAYLDEFGWRAETWGQPELPTWAENPRTPLMLIGRYLADPDHAAAAALRRSVVQREAAAREVEARLSPEALTAFREALAAAQTHVAVSEGRALWQLIIIGSLRVPVQALGRKLVAAGAFSQPEDAFYFTTDELRRASEAPGPHIKDEVAARRADFKRWEAMTPPPFLGAPLDLDHVPPEMRPLVYLFLGAGPPQVEGREIKGQPASRGVVRGRARIIESLGEADRLQAGEVLVCTTTAPPWTPLFAIAAAVVTDTGGVLSHSAICAREYAIPCVVATQVATKLIPDGAMVTVDGIQGVVTIEG
jgi:pyruvate,water dikinase